MDWQGLYQPSEQLGAPVGDDKKESRENQRNSLV